ncbi:hypothetical protein DPMN_149549 [Dreissena polymorpha]|uniref:Uncharacterized protein n=1 Tax=Dreissena polymorpha TaxID=45954 RepID=A0A9D4FBY5_DREPO|nr:hypothetical protein DPMN_149549 [Dreissena polymorpha]
MAIGCWWNVYPGCANLIESGNRTGKVSFENAQKVKSIASSFEEKALEYIASNTISTKMHFVNCMSHWSLSATN